MPLRYLSLLMLAALFMLHTSCLRDEVAVNSYIYSAEEYALLSHTLDISPDNIDYSVKLPQYMKDRGMQEPLIDNSKALLGRVLFYDHKLSKNEAVSCASCHHQQLAFSDDKAFSEGFEGHLTKRNSLALAAVANFESSYGSGSSDRRMLSGPVARFFWDERAGNISEQSRLTIEDNIEMGMTMHEVVDRVKNTGYYPILFERAFGTPDIQSQHVTQALEVFINSMVSVNSRFDNGMEKHTTMHRAFDNFTSQENLGKSLYLTNCVGCHGDMSVSAMTVANNGLDRVSEDEGVGGVTLMPHQVGVFKVPFLRNVARTGPYMHDGRFATLEEVVEHYSTGIQPHDNLSLQLKDLATDQPKRMNFSQEEKTALVAFLHTLTDPVIISEERYSNPFKR